MCCCRKNPCAEFLRRCLQATEQDCEVRPHRDARPLHRPLAGCTLIPHCEYQVVMNTKIWLLLCSCAFVPFFAFCTFLLRLYNLRLYIFASLRLVALSCFACGLAVPFPRFVFSSYYCLSKNFPISECGIIICSKMRRDFAAGAIRTARFTGLTAPKKRAMLLILHHVCPSLLCPCSFASNTVSSAIWRLDTQS